MKKIGNEEPVRLDRKDCRLLLGLDMDARATLSELSKKVGLSKQSVGYRISRLARLGVIEGFYAVLDIPKLGYIFARLFIEFKDISPKIEQDILEYCIKQKQFGWLIKTEGKWDFVVVLYGQDLLDIKRLINEFLYRHGSLINNYQASIVTSIYHFPHNYLARQKGGSQIVLGGRLEHAKLDRLDSELLNLIAADSRMPLIELGGKLGISYKVASYRLKRLESQNIILAYRTSINTQALGYSYYKVILTLQNANEKRLGEFKSFLSYHRNVLYITEAVGFADIEFEAVFKTTAGLYGMLTELRTRFSDMIKNYETLLVVRFYRMSYLPGS